MKEPENRNSLSYQDYVEGTRTLLEASKKETEPYRVTVLNKEFIVLPGVFSPRYFNDTELFAAHLPTKEGETVLEIGSGTGVISIVAICKGAKRVVAIDINPEAVKNTRANAELHQVKDRIDVRDGNLYAPLAPDEKFDTIFWNTPFGFIEEDEISDLEKAVYDPHYRSTETFFKEAATYLKPGGRVLIGFSTTLGRLDLLQKFAIEANLSLRLLYGAVSEEVHPVRFEIFEARAKP